MLFCSYFNFLNTETYAGNCKAYACKKQEMLTNVFSRRIQSIVYPLEAKAIRPGELDGKIVGLIIYSRVDDR